MIEDYSETILATKSDICNSDRQWVQSVPPSSDLCHKLSKSIKL